MALIDIFFTTPKPGWMVREHGRRFVEICLVPVDIMVEGMYQARLAIFGTEPPPDSIKYLARDRGIVPGLNESIFSYMLRLRRWLWSKRAAGLPGIANVFVDQISWPWGSPSDVSGTPTEVGNVLYLNNGGMIGTPGLMYNVSTDGGETTTGPFALGASDTFTVGDVSVTFPMGTPMEGGILYLWHGGAGLLLNDLGAPTRIGTAASPAGPESLLHELAATLRPNPPRIRLIDASGTWWTRKPDGYVWRVNMAPWAWETAKDDDEEWWARGLIVLDSPDGVVPWELIGSSTHKLNEPQASFGTTAEMEWWNRMLVTTQQWKPSHMQIVNVILNFDPDAFNPALPATCSQGDWYQAHDVDEDGHAYNTRPTTMRFSSTM